MDHNNQIRKAIKDLESQEYHNVSATAEKYKVARKTLEDRWKGKSVSIKEANSMYRQALTNAQEQALIDVINQLTARRMPPTPAMVIKLAEEIRGCKVGKNWASEFVQRHKVKLKSVYLSGIDSKRVKSEFHPAYVYFFELVKLFCVACIVIIS